MIFGSISGVQWSLLNLGAPSAEQLGKKFLLLIGHQFLFVWRREVTDFIKAACERKLDYHAGVDTHGQ